ncbi:hypothetical protein BCR33DRAFT_710880 [Rhizoclosmatium globosum]|uniref:Uncharacterized protein n=1 Tax=Rhizoclosmatium globosum TaxID=329046 RepID=A0A1Y2D2D6_9FUNG|nr:hypothetical protein BCR33DRAFT_710880 [Rhizoclosmatium globosum]|eukprot:ORY53453.1 hypothetical protein BCR33DRAFT_710880 [Rhizoclosmatium globosum]
MNTLASQELLWKELCKWRWADKKHQEHALHPFVDYSGILEKLTREQKLDVLRRRVVKIAKLAEFSEQKLNDLVVKTTPVGLRGVRIYKPIRCGKWQASFIAAELDSTRHDLSKVELCLYDWIYEDLYDEEDEGEIRVKFWPHGTRGNVDGSDNPYEVPYYTKPDGRVQVHHYPRHEKPMRLLDWGWRFGNPYVIYTSVDPPVLIEED